jgi:hypothetical protein
VPPAHLRYIQAGERSGADWKDVAHVLGAGLGKPAREGWASSRYSEVAALIGRGTPLVGHARLSHAVRLLSQAILDRRPALRMLATVIAIEGLLCGAARNTSLARRASSSPAARQLTRSAVVAGPLAIS